MGPTIEGTSLTVAGRKLAGVRTSMGFLITGDHQEPVELMLLAKRKFSAGGKFLLTAFHARMPRPTLLQFGPK
jgi:hypothetical protein